MVGERPCISQEGLVSDIIRHIIGTLRFLFRNVFIGCFVHGIFVFSVCLRQLIILGDFVILHLWRQGIIREILCCILVHVIRSCCGSVCFLWFTFEVVFYSLSLIEAMDGVHQVIHAVP